MIRPATIDDVPRIQDIINSHAEPGRMLFKLIEALVDAGKARRAAGSVSAVAGGCGGGSGGRVRAEIARQWRAAAMAKLGPYGWSGAG
jgi:hypothetical protein